MMFVYWKFQDKNPFSEFSEEHLNKLDEVLSSAGVQELLQQSGQDLGILNLAGSEQLPTGANELPSSSRTRRDSMDSLPVS